MNNTTLHHWISSSNSTTSQIVHGYLFNFIYLYLFYSGIKWGWFGNRYYKLTYLINILYKSEYDVSTYQ